MIITDGYMKSEHTTTVAYQLDSGWWIVSDRPHQLYDYNQAITALTLAEVRGTDLEDLPALIEAWEAELT